MNYAFHINRFFDISPSWNTVPIRIKSNAQANIDKKKSVLYDIWIITAIARVKDLTQINWRATWYISFERHVQNDQCTTQVYWPLFVCLFSSITPIINLLGEKVDNGPTFSRSLREEQRGTEFLSTNKASLDRIKINWNNHDMASCYCC